MAKLAIIGGRAVMAIVATPTVRDYDDNNNNDEDYDDDYYYY